jgi:adenosylcobyric acid synthase
MFASLHEIRQTTQFFWPPCKDYPLTAKTLMVQGASSSAGKSLLVTALCRIYARRGVRVAPFKAQNMSNNAAVCPDGGEIGRAQYTQAMAAGIIPATAMNPVLLKPEADNRSQVVVMGKVMESLPSRDYYARKQMLWSYVTTAIDSLRESYELIIIEGAGSPAELNLKQNDIVNMAVAGYANAPVLLVGDIDRGGIFAQLLGTLWLLEPEERALVKGLIVNKFRGDLTLFQDGVSILEDRGGVPVLGVLPYIHDLAIPEEDAVALENRAETASKNAQIDIAVIHFPRIANFDDFDPLANESGVELRYVASPTELGQPDAIILPGTKSTIADLNWLRERGLADAISALEVPVVGICGGYQMLGQSIHDPEKLESAQAYSEGLGLLPIQTTFEGQKATYQAKAVIAQFDGWLGNIAGSEISGYEIHMGRSTGVNPWLTICQRSNETVHLPDGSISPDGRIWGCYLHGLFHNRDFRHAWLGSLGWQSEGLADESDAFGRLADAVESALDIQKLDKIIGLK